MNAKASSGGEEEALRMRSKILGQSDRSGEIQRGPVILVAYLIATLDLTFLFMQMGIIPVSMGCPASQHTLPWMPDYVVFQQNQKRVCSRRQESVFLLSRQALIVFRVCPGSKSWYCSSTHSPFLASWTPVKLM